MKRPVLALAICLATTSVSHAFADQLCPSKLSKANSSLEQPLSVPAVANRRFPVLAENASDLPETPLESLRRLTASTTTPSTQTASVRRFPKLSSGNDFPNTPLESLRRLVAARNLERHQIADDTLIPMLPEHGEDRAAAAIKVVAVVVVEEPMPLEAKMQPAVPTYRVTPRLVQAEQRLQHWLEPNIGTDFIADEATVIAELKASQIDSSVITPSVAADSQTPILPEFTIASTLSVDPFTNGEFRCFDSEADQLASKPLARETKAVAATTVIFFDDDFEEEDLPFTDQIAVQGNGRSIR